MVKTAVVEQTKDRLWNGLYNGRPIIMDGYSDVGGMVQESFEMGAERVLLVTYPVVHHRTSDWIWNGQGHYVSAESTLDRFESVDELLKYVMISRSIDRFGSVLIHTHGQRG